MASLSIKDVPEEWAEALRKRAVRHHRSLQGELMALIERAVVDESGGLAGPLSATTTGVAKSAPSAARPVISLDRLGHPITRRGTKTIEQIHVEHMARFPESITQGPMSVDIIRQDRDSR